MRHRLSLLLVPVLICCLSAACTNNTAQHEPQSPAPAVTTGVAPFSQPTFTGELLTGRLPQDQGHISPKELAELDARFHAHLKAQAHRTVTPLPAMTDSLSTRYRTDYTTSLPLWTAYGKQHNVDLLLVPMIIDWHQRQGSPAGVTDSAAVHVEFYLIDVRTGDITGRSVLREKQVGLTENLLTMPDFLKRHGAWITAQELAEEGMANAINELGL